MRPTAITSPKSAAVTTAAVAQRAVSPATAFGSVAYVSSAIASSNVAPDVSTVTDDSAGEASGAATADASGAPIST